MEFIETTSCLFCDATFSLVFKGLNTIVDPDWKKQVDVIRAHLINDHFFVIDNIFEVCKLPSYLKYWKEKFKKQPITDFCSVIKTNTGPNDLEPSQTFYFLCPDVLPEDKNLRNRLAVERLKSVLQDQDNERKETDFSRQCLFCKTICTGNRKDLLNHLEEKHNFSVGDADNMVYVKELMDLLSKKLNELKCFYCEKTFKDWDVLKEHMRKKQHKQLNPDDKQYDSFYVINYLEPGKTWKDFMKEKDSNDRDIDKIQGHWNDWIEESLDSRDVELVCLFCKEIKTQISELKEHMNDQHSFDFDHLVKNYTFYQRVKIVNFIRKKMICSTCHVCLEFFPDLRQHFFDSGHWRDLPKESDWENPKYLLPSLKNDNLLCCLGDEKDIPCCSNHITKESVIAEDIKIIELKDVSPEIRDLIKIREG
jgi:hypothetical protein